VPVHPAAAGGFSSAASTYARIRPTYARPVIGALKESCRGGRVLDVGAGTGILTGQLVRAGVDVLAVEPLPAMARQLRLALPSVPVALGVAEALPAADSSVDAVTVAQAFHWFDAPDALAEAARVLRPGGLLAMVWNARDESVPWVEELTDLVERRTGGRPYVDHRERPWEDVVAAADSFGEPSVERHPNPVATTVAGVLDRLRSTSFVAALDESERTALLAEAAGLLAAHPECTGTFPYPHDTVLYRWHRLDHRG
jgi:ubiquinone/menaquinone biosynthesis C-methylase UbiE